MSGCIKHQLQRLRGGGEFPSTGSVENLLTMKRRGSRRRVSAARRHVLQAERKCDSEGSAAGRKQV